MIGFLTFLLFLAGSVVLFTYVSWRLNGRRDGEFKLFLRNRYEEYREQKAERSDLAAGNLKIIRSRELPEAPPRQPGEHDGMEINETDRDSEIQRLNKLFGDS